MKITMKDVAKASRVAPSTVSNFINNSAPVSAGAKERITKAMEALNYLPTQAASHSKKTAQIGLFMPETSNVPNRINLDQVLVDLVYGIGEQLRGANYNLVLLWKKDHKKVAESLISEKSIDGIIYPTPVSNDPTPEILKLNKIPHVIIGRTSDSQAYHSVDVDNISTSQVLTQHLISLGHKRIAFIAPCEFEFMVSFDRLTGFQMIMQMNQLPILDGYIRIGDAEIETGFRIATELLELPEPPTAILAGRDSLALGAILAIRAKGLSVPHDVAVTGSESTMISETHDITSISNSLYTVGAEATRLLIEIIEAPEIPYKKIIIPSYLVVRGSTSIQANTKM